MPPSIAPGIDPIPPITAAVNALIPGSEPKVGVIKGTFIRLNRPARAARAEPITKVMLIMKFIPTA